jgi:quercetin dioxygenase-like cupin family protein
MYRIRVEELKKVGMSRVFVGAERGDVGVSAYLVSAPPGKGPPPHTHPYDKVAFVQSGRARWTVNGEALEVGAGEILVVKAGEVHNFTSVGEVDLVQLDVHLSPRFIQENV